MKDNERGISIFNIILFLVMIIFLVFLALIIFDNSNTLTSQSKTNMIELKESTTNIASRYYYNEIDDGCKIMYDTIWQNVGALMDGNTKIAFQKNNSISEEKFQTAWDALVLDKPEIFYVDTNNLTLVTKKTIYFGVSNNVYTLQPKDDKMYYISPFSSRADIDTATSQIDKVVSEVKNIASGTRFDKVKLVHDYIIDNVSYDQNNDPDNSNIYGALVKKTAVCEGYASAFKYILDQLGIPCLSVYGDGIDSNGSSKSHAWNYVLMDDNKWYAVDTTWDDPILIGRGTISSESRYRYFLRGSNDFEPTHKEDGDVSGTGQKFTYPTLSTEDY